MLQEYVFEEGTVEFDDSRSVKELIAHAFDAFGYYEPLGMDIVTVFQRHHPQTSTGWFTTDVEKRCADEIVNTKELCFAYHMPEVFYFAEGGRGHHMPTLGNHPRIPEAVSLHLRFDEFNNTVVINGRYRFTDIIHTLVRSGYIEQDCSRIRVIPVGLGHEAYDIPFSDPILQLSLSDFKKALPQHHKKHIDEDRIRHIYHEILEIC